MSDRIEIWARCRDCGLRTQFWIRPQDYNDWLAAYFSKKPCDKCAAQTKLFE